MNISFEFQLIIDLEGVRQVNIIGIKDCLEKDFLNIK